MGGRIKGVTERIDGVFQQYLPAPAVPARPDHWPSEDFGGHGAAFGAEGFAGAAVGVAVGVIEQ